jgi:predicted regulator of Ras-like GTPase activity (Roadblock/LC7/MglB family)
MADGLNELLARLRADNGLDLAAVSADGLMVGADSIDELDVEGVCATVGDVFLMMTALGTELERGEPNMLTIEYDAGTMIVSPLNHGAALVMLTGSALNLGRLRIATRRFQEQYAEAAV